MLPVWYYRFQRKVRLGDLRAGLRHAIDYIGDPGLPIEIEVLAFGATERGTENGGVARSLGSEALWPPHPAVEASAQIRANEPR